MNLGSTPNFFLQCGQLAQNFMGVFFIALAIKERIKSGSRLLFCPAIAGGSAAG